MYKLQYVNPHLEEKLEAPQKHYPEAMCQELYPFIEALKRDGRISRTDYYRGNINRISANTFTLYYVPDLQNGLVKVLDLKENPWELLKKQFSLSDSWDDADCIDIIPQCDPPEKLLNAIQLIFQGVTDSYELGYELGHQGKKSEYISRHGNYARQALDCLKLTISTKQGRKLVPVLTDRGRKIAQASDRFEREKLLIIAMLEYSPVRDVLQAITEGSNDFNDLTVQELVFPEALRSSSTCPRRTQTIKSWIRWISETSGIPIRLPGGVKQLTLDVYQK